MSGPAADRVVGVRSSGGGGHFRRGERGAVIDAEGGSERPSPRPGLEGDFATLSMRGIELTGGIDESEREASIDPRASSTSEYEAREEVEAEDGSEDCEAEEGRDRSESSEGREGYDSKGGDGSGS